MNVFSNLTSPDSIYILLWLLGASLIGLIVGWFVWGTAKRALEVEILQLRNRLTVATDENDNQRVEIESLNAQLNENTTEIKEKKARIHDIEIEKSNLHTQIYELKDRIKSGEEAQKRATADLNRITAEQAAEKQQFAAAIAQIATLQSEKQTLEIEKQTLENEKQIRHESYAAAPNLEHELKLAQTRVAILEGNIEAYKEELAAAEAELAKFPPAPETETEAVEIETGETTEEAKAAARAVFGAAARGLDAPEKDDLTKINGIGSFIEKQLNDIGITQFQQIADLNGEMIEKITTAIGFFEGRIERDQWVAQAQAFLTETDEPLNARGLDAENEADEVEEFVVEGAPAIGNDEVTLAQESLKSKIGTEIPTATAEEKDDLTIISGIGVFIEEKLNALGIFTYEQIATFDEKTEEELAAAIGFFPGRISRDEWVRQAQDLWKQKQANNAVNSLAKLFGNRISAASPEDKDDLKRINGVGPFIEEKLNALGIYTFQQISEFDDEIIELVTSAISFFPDRIKRDDWAGQAAEFLKA